MTSSTPVPRASSDASPPPRRPPRAALLLLAALATTATVYSNALQGPFIWDDHLLIRSMPEAQQLNPLPHLSRAFWARTPDRDADAYYYRPLTSWSYALDGTRAGGPFHFHVTNVLLHLLCVALVFLLAVRLGAAPVSAALGAAIFGVFPRLTESVTWISGRTDLLAAALGVGALLLHGAPGARLGRRLAAAVLLLLGLLAKEVAAAAAVGLICLELAATRRAEKPLRAALRDLIPCGLTMAAYAVLRWRALSGVHSPERVVPHRALIPFQALGRYALMLVDPRPQIQIGLRGVLEPLPLALGMILALALLAGLVELLRHPPAPLVCATLATATVALVLVLHVLFLRLVTVAADRFLYLPLACLVALLASGARHLSPRWRRGAGVAAAILVAAYAPVTVTRNEDWSDEIRFWRTGVKTTDPRNAIPWNELGNVLAGAGQLDEALAMYKSVLPRTTGSKRVETLANIATTLADLGRFDEARNRLIELMVLQPDRAVTHFNLAVIDLRLLRFDDAQAELGQAVHLFPEYEEARRVAAMLPALRSAASGLPTERADEPAEVRARRAQLWGRLTVPSRAIPLWRAVLADPRAPLPAIAEGAAYLVATADRQTARWAIDQARTASVSAALLSGLEAGLADRFAVDATEDRRP